MLDGLDALAPLEAALLVATFTGPDTTSYRDLVWERLLGAEDDPWTRLSEEDRALARSLVDEALTGNLSTHQLISVNSPERDEPFPLLLHFIPVHLPQPSRKTRIAAVTVTGEILAEPTSWTASQTQRHRMETLGRMTMGIAHDFNNLLGGILGHTELMRSVISGNGYAQELRDNLRTIEQAALDGAALIRKIQQYIRQEKQDRYELVDANQLIEDCVALTRPYWYNEPRRQGIAIHTDLQLGEIPQILGSPTELREIFVNLILNAVHAMPEGGAINFTTRTLPNRHVEIKVRDTGIGMSDSLRRRIFEPLFSTKGESGTGMGLAVSYGIIQAHDGTIEVASQVGRGTEFTLTFPPAELANPEKAPEATQQPGRKARVLIVDDEPMVRNVLARLLSLNGHTVTQAESASMALSLVDSQTFDIVFTDKGMPEMNGIDLAHTLNERHPDLPIVLLTGDTETGEPGNGIAAVLPKPFKLDQLEATIQTLLS